MADYQTPARVLVTGVAGNLGRKVVEALASTSWCASIIGVDWVPQNVAFSPQAEARFQWVVADLTQANGAWTELLDSVDAVIHLAAIHSTPDATWEQALASYGMTLNVLEAAATRGVRRLVFASSNHAMGAYKDQPLAGTIGPGKLVAELDPAPGTRWHNGIEEVHSLAYGTSKAMGERLCQAVAQVSNGRLSIVSLRIGWALPDENDPNDINHSGTADTPVPGELPDEASHIALRWFRNMWLSNEDLRRLFLSAITADPASWPAPAIVVNGVSNNTGMDWGLETGRRLIGYDPQDDLYALLKSRG
ncbi:Uronate dehydrogenase [Ralstonia condita]|uniref:Uronate dehydrogenase n=1 Tax=Ralstonia condita TaxID=3058600 RepID=A0ABM9J8X3_9RALS|nr:NAD(P)-dependent oxidoreductase [Ralstonia sp. LMG 7141]CAJ0786571.1 Uronate dehydrogenase [Ralstonia sp. LMG 7141]